jgi:hypothetical protein
MKTKAQLERQLNLKRYTSGEEHQIAVFIARIAINDFTIPVGEIESHLRNVPSWSVRCIAADAPVRGAELSTPAVERIIKLTKSIMKEWQTRREQGAN